MKEFSVLSQESGDEINHLNILIDGVRLEDVIARIPFMTQSQLMELNDAIHSYEDEPLYLGLTATLVLTDNDQMIGPVNQLWQAICDRWKQYEADVKALFAKKVEDSGWLHFKATDESQETYLAPFTQAIKIYSDIFGEGIVKNVWYEVFPCLNPNINAPAIACDSEVGLAENSRAMSVSIEPAGVVLELMNGRFLKFSVSEWAQVSLLPQTL